MNAREAKAPSAADPVRQAWRKPPGAGCPRVVLLPTSATSPHVRRPGTASMRWGNVGLGQHAVWPQSYLERKRPS